MARQLSGPTNPKGGLLNLIRHRAARDWQLYVLLLPLLVYFAVFHYLPMYGVQIAFRQYRFVDGITGSRWVGWKHFEDFTNAYFFGRLL